MAGRLEETLSTWECSFWSRHDQRCCERWWVMVRSCTKVGAGELGHTGRASRATQNAAGLALRLPAAVVLTVHMVA